VTGSGVLVVGYGNSLRGDDGAGWHAAARLAADPRLTGARVLARHQLTPELAAEVATASLVVLVDATTDAPPGSVLLGRVNPTPPTSPGSDLPRRDHPIPPGSVQLGRDHPIQPGSVQLGRDHPTLPAPATWSHHFGPEHLAALAEGLYGATPPIVLACVGVRGNSFTSDRLSTTLEQALPDLVELVAQLALGRVRVPVGGVARVGPGVRSGSPGQEADPG
jgi:Ni,Fe-hydrogenase maturation factor